VLLAELDPPPVCEVETAPWRLAALKFEAPPPAEAAETASPLAKEPANEPAVAELAATLSAYA
jgi:hypothetical protein